MKAVEWAPCAAMVLSLWLASLASAAPPPSGSAEEARRDLPLEATVVSPDWDRKPSGDELAQLYPPLAETLALEGKATIRCVVQIDGALSGCKVISETPAGLGFGYATLLAAVDFHMTPQRMDGRPVKGSVTIPLVWKPAEGSTSPPPHSDAALGPEPSVGAMTLARRLLETEHGAQRIIESLDKRADDRIQAMEKNGGPAPSPDQERLVKSLLHQGFTSSVARLEEQQARRYAQELTIPLLAQTVRFLESPAGQAFLMAGRHVAAQDAKAFWVDYEARAQARAAFCAQTACVK